MNSCKSLFRASLSSSPLVHLPNPNSSITLVSFRAFSVLRPNPSTHSTGPPRCALHEAASLQVLETLTENPPSDPAVSVKELLTTNRNDASSMMKMERRKSSFSNGERRGSWWFPYEDRFRCGDVHLTSREVLEAVSPHMMEERSDRFRRVVENRSFSVCLVVEGLSDIGNISAAFRSADALGIQSVHVVASDSFKRYRNNRHVSMGAEKWLDIELWDTPKECFNVLKSRGYRIATTHLGMDTVSIYDMDWSQPTAIVVGNEGSGISEEALELSDLYCSIPMNGMVDSFNVSVAAGIVMHHAVCDRTARLGSHGDLSAEEKEILMAEFSLRHSRSSLFIASEFAKRRQQQQYSASF
ncbi:tRNA/rRNA methyltransferase [Hirschfeldia incana]|nr:tRNA/rRNA methyltransferase [Hirschfeldia incana]